MPYVPGRSAGAPSGTGRAAVLGWCQYGSGRHCPISSGGAIGRERLWVPFMSSERRSLLLWNCLLLKPSLRSGVTCGVSLQLDEGCGEGSLRSVLMEPGATAGLQPP